MKATKSLNLGSNDAENYRRSEQKQFFNDIFVKDINLERLLQLQNYFLIGEKGTGKTAYAVFLANNDYKNTKSQIKYIRETEYLKFISLKEKNHLLLSDYAAIWKVILLVLIASKIENKDIFTDFSKPFKLQSIQNVIRDYYKLGFSPEIYNVMEIVDQSELSVNLLNKAFGGEAGKSKAIKTSTTNFQTNLQELYRNLLSALTDIKLKQNHFLFIDGIDFRPSNILYEEYLECIKGLANAVWALNTDVFGALGGGRGQIKIVLLLRPDIFNSLDLQNATNKITNNSVYLDWRTTYPEYRNSKLFELSDNLLKHQQEDFMKYRLGEVWDHYFPWDLPSTSPHRDNDHSFIEMLRLSFSRPRDIVTILILLQQNLGPSGGSVDYFPLDIFKSQKFKNDYSNYVMGSIKDQLSFYYSSQEYQYLLTFLSQFKGHVQFEYSYFIEQYKIFSNYLVKVVKDEFPAFVDSPEQLLQFLYDANVICYIDQDTYGKDEFFFCYRQREISNITPSVKTGKVYRFHYGLIRALSL